jgi:predicted phage tail protein
MSSKVSSLPLILIALAMTGAGVSYHFTLDARFAAIEQKLDQNAIALQQFQIAQESAASAKTDTLDGLSKEVDALETSLAPLGKATKEQTDALAQIRQQISSLGQLQQAQADAQKKLADYAGQLEQIKHDVQLHEAQASSGTSNDGSVPPNVPLPSAAPLPASLSAPAAAPASAPSTSTQVPTTHASTVSAKALMTPLTEGSSVDLRPAEMTVVRTASVRA